MGDDVRLGGLIFAVAWGWPRECAVPRRDRMHEDNMKIQFYWDQLKSVDSFGDIFCIIKIRNTFLK